MAFWTFRNLHKLGNALFGTRALRTGKRMQDEILSTGKRPFIIGFFTFFNSVTYLFNVVFWIDRDFWGVVGKENPIAGFLGQGIPRLIDIVAQ